VATLPDEADELYALPLEEFTPARDSLAKRLRDDGDKEAAAGVKALRKPSVPAWAVNQVARADKKAVDALFDAGARLQDAQKKLMRGGDAKAVQEATAAERDAVKKLLAAARKRLEAGGHGATESTLERVADSFYATAVDPDARENVRAGRLTKELKRVGFGEVPELSLVPGGKSERPVSRGPGAKERKEAEKRAREADDAEQAALAAEERAAELARKADEAKARATDAKAEARFARRAADTKRREAEKLAAKLQRKT
jgi:hypothetical protein